jgi:hypothetical protein
MYELCNRLISASTVSGAEFAGAEHAPCQRGWQWDGEGDRVATGRRIGGMKNSKVRASTYSFSRITTAANAFQDLLGLRRAQLAAISYPVRPIRIISATWPGIDDVGLDSHWRLSVSVTNRAVARMLECGVHRSQTWYASMTQDFESGIGNL